MFWYYLVLIEHILESTCCKQLIVNLDFRFNLISNLAVTTTSTCGRKCFTLQNMDVTRITLLVYGRLREGR